MMNHCLICGKEIYQFDIVDGKAHYFKEHEWCVKRCLLCNKKALKDFDFCSTTCAKYFTRFQAMKTTDIWGINHETD